MNLSAVYYNLKWPIESSIIVVIFLLDVMHLRGRSLNWTLTSKILDSTIYKVLSTIFPSDPTLSLCLLEGNVATSQQKKKKKKSGDTSWISSSWSFFFFHLHNLPTSDTRFVYLSSVSMYSFAPTYVTFYRFSFSCWIEDYVFSFNLVMLVIVVSPITFFPSWWNFFHKK